MSTREFRCYGPPGTGKTTWLSKQAKNAADKYGASSVVIASLTRAAAAEIGGRDSGIPKENVATLHSHAFHALGRPKIAESKEGIADWNSRAKSKRWQIGGGKVFDPENPPVDGSIDFSDADRLLSEIAVYRQRMTPRELWRTEVQRFAKEWDQFKLDTGRLDFTDLIEKAIAEIEAHHVYPKVFLLDEAQDMSRLEMTLARQWGEKCEVFVIVGDPWQNLYQWRGSDPEAFTAGEVSGTMVLDQSYRVPAAVQQYAIDWISNIVREGDVFPEYKPRDEPGEVVVSPYTWNFPEALIASFEADIEAERSVMILASCGYMLNPMIAQLRKRGLPFHNPYREVHGGWNPLRYSDRVLAFMRPNGTVWPGENRLWTYEDLRLWTDVLAAAPTMTRGSKSHIETMAAAHEAQRFNEDLPPQPLELDVILSMFKPEVHDAVFDMDLDWLKANTRDSRRRVIDYPVAVAKKYGATALREEPKIIIGTIHSVKGGEADSVYVFPDLSRQGYEGWTRHGNTRDATYRQFYVAFTRARHKLVLLAPHGSESVTFKRPKGSST